MEKCGKLCVCACAGWCVCVCVCVERDFIRFCCHIPNVTLLSRACWVPSAPSTWFFRGGDSLRVWVTPVELWLLSTSVRAVPCCHCWKCSAPCHTRPPPAHFQSDLMAKELQSCHSLFTVHPSPTLPSEMQIFLNILPWWWILHLR